MTHSRISGSKMPLFRLASHKIVQSLIGPQIKLPRVMPTNGGKLMRPIWADEKFHGGPSIQAESVTVIMILQAVMTP